MTRAKVEALVTACAAPLEAVISRASGQNRTKTGQYTRRILSWKADDRDDDINNGGRRAWCRSSLLWQVRRYGHD